MFPFPLTPIDRFNSMEMWQWGLTGQGVIGGHDILYWPAPRSAQDTASEERAGGMVVVGGKTITYYVFWSL